jgi:hypothetical protein
MRRKRIEKIIRFTLLWVLPPRRRNLLGDIVITSDIKNASSMPLTLKKVELKGPNKKETG